MKLQYCLFIFFTFSFWTPIIGQNSANEWFIAPNWNLYLPIKNPSKGTYPIIGYDKESRPKLLIGGYGISASVLKMTEKKISWRGQGNFSRYVYWDEPFVVTNVFGVPIAAITTGTVDYFMGFTGAVNYKLSKKIIIGSGLGGQVLFYSLSKLPQFENNARLKDLIAVNHSYRIFQPIIPVELSLKHKKFLFNLRYEYALLNRFRGDLANYKSDKYSLLNFEIGLKLN
ncbi:MAG: hypothetical protein U0X91_26220 [Spirosomataceae bacterium]